MSYDGAGVNVRKTIFSRFSKNRIFSVIFPKTAEKYYFSAVHTCTIVLSIFIYSFFFVFPAQYEECEENTAALLKFLRRDHYQELCGYNGKSVPHILDILNAKKNDTSLMEPGKNDSTSNADAHARFARAVFQLAGNDVTSNQPFHSEMRELLASGSFSQDEIKAISYILSRTRRTRMDSKGGHRRSRSKSRRRGSGDRHQRRHALWDTDQPGAETIRRKESKSRESLEALRDLDDNVDSHNDAYFETSDELLQNNYRSYVNSYHSGRNIRAAPSGGAAVVDDDFTPPENCTATKDVYVDHGHHKGEVLHHIAHILHICSIVILGIFVFEVSYHHMTEALVAQTSMLFLN